MKDYCEGQFEPKGITFSGESKPTIKQYGACRQFVCTDSETRLFVMHTKLISSNQRIYYFPIPEQEVVHIGYVGKHLPTVRHTT